MALYNNTRAMIRSGFITLLDEQPFSRITVRGITDCCGISRNTFYYYYQDIYALLEDVFNVEIERISAGVQDYDSWQKAFLEATAFARAHRKAIFHVHSSANHALLEQYYQKTILSAILAYVRREAEGLAVSERSILALARFYTAALTGLTIDWLNSGMKGDPAALLDDLGPLLNGNIRASLERTAQGQQGIK